MYHLTKLPTTGKSLLKKWRKRGKKEGFMFYSFFHCFDPYKWTFPIDLSLQWEWLCKRQAVRAEQWYEVKLRGIFMTFHHRYPTKRVGISLLLCQLNVSKRMAQFEIGQANTESAVKVFFMPLVRRCSTRPPSIAYLGFVTVSFR